MATESSDERTVEIDPEAGIVVARCGSRRVVLRGGTHLVPVPRVGHIQGSVIERHVVTHRARGEPGADGAGGTHADVEPGFQRSAAPYNMGELSVKIRDS